MTNLRKLLYVVSTLIVGIINLQAQEHKCFSDQFLEAQILADPSTTGRINSLDANIQHYLNERPVILEKSSGSLIIPVVVYIVHGGGPENISDTQVISQMNALNGYFSDYGINFCLATEDNGTALPGITTPGIIRVNNPVLTNHNANTDQAALKSTSTLSNERYLKIWVVNSINGGTANGYSILPDVAPDDYDGIVMAFDAFGDIATCGCGTLNPSSQDGKILVHEVGHYLGLYHTFNGGCAGMNPATCETEGDRVCDTPPVATPNSGCPGGAWNTCSESPDLPDHVNNYMDYTNELCLNSFTDGQEDRMHALISLYRATLVSGANHIYTGINCNGGLLAGFTASNYAPCVGTAVTFSASTVPGATYAWEFGDGTTATGATVSHTYASAYDPASVVLTISDGVSSVSAVQNLYVTACTPITSSQGNWYFFDRNSLSFASGAPVYNDAAFVNNTFNTAEMGVVNESSAVQSDADGNLLFYTDGIHLWNASHSLVTGGLHGHYSSMSGVLIVPDPANDEMYYVFTSDKRWNSGRGFKYSKVDVSSGSAVMSGPLNVPITVPVIHGFRIAAVTDAVITGEGITAVASPDGYWIIAETVKDGETTHALVYELTASGLSFNNTIPIGTLQSVIPLSHVDASNIKASPNGKRVVFASSVWLNELDYVFDFNPCNGELSNQRTIPLSTKNNYGWAFAENSNLLYGSRQGNIFQYNLEPCEIEVVTVCAIAPSTIQSLQMGADGKIYGAVNAENQLITIHQPSNLCTIASPNACIFDENGPAMENGTVMRSGLPNMIAATDLSVFSNEISYTLAACSEVCNTYDFTGDLCATTYSWNFGDPASGISNTSIAQNPTHTFSGPGTYIVTLVTDAITVTTTIEVGLIPTIAGSLTICPEVSMIGNYSIDLAPGYSVLWSALGGTVVGLNDQADVTINWSSLPGVLSLILVNDITGCESSATITITESCESCVCDMEPSFTASVTPECVYIFDGFSGADDCVEITEWKWTFGDGTIAYGEHVTHVFPGPGTYVVCLGVTGTNGEAECYYSNCRRISVRCESAECPCEIKPDFKISLDRTTCIYTFTETADVSECQKNVSYYWDFGDGTTSIGYEVGHLYSEPGEYEVCLTVVVTDDKGKTICKDRICKVIEVECVGKCDCKLDPSFTMVANGECNFTFTGLSGSECTNISSYEWYVNGVLVSSLQVLHQDFVVNTSYEVCLIVKGYADDVECEEKYCETFYYTDCYPIFGVKTMMNEDEPVVEIYPNPAQTSTTIAFELAEKGPVTVTLRSAEGKIIATINEEFRAGAQTMLIPLTDIASGVIMVEVIFDNHQVVKRLVVVR